MDGELCLNAEKPIDTFWYDIEPSYVRGRRKKNNNLDRIEFGMMDNRGYGLKISQRDGVYYCKMAAMPSSDAKGATFATLITECKSGIDIASYSHFQPRSRHSSRLD